MVRRKQPGESLAGVKEGREQCWQRKKDSRRSTVGPNLPYLGNRKNAKSLYHRRKKRGIVDNSI